MDERIRSLHAELAFPSATRLQAALRKEGITAPLSKLKEITSTVGARQVLQPPPSYKGNITSSKIDDRWVADVISFESRPAKLSGSKYTNVLLVQDIFSRFVWVVPLASKSRTREAFESILGERKPRELNTDKGTEFTSREFQVM